MEIIWINLNKLISRIDHFFIGPTPPFFDPFFASFLIILIFFYCLCCFFPYSVCFCMMNISFLCLFATLSFLTSSSTLLY